MGTPISPTAEEREMPVGVIMDFAGGDAAAYDRVIERMGLQDGVTPDGATFHAAGPYEGGWRVVDVWEDQATFGQFAETQIGPQAGAEGFPEPSIQFIPIDEMYDERDSDQEMTHLQIVRLTGMDKEGFQDADSDIRDNLAPPEGCVFHINGPSDDGWIVVDAWTSKDVRDQFIADKVVPAMQARNVSPPTIEDVSIHNTIAPAKAEA